MSVDLSRDFTDSYRRGFTDGYEDGLSDGQGQGYRDAKYRAYRAVDAALEGSERRKAQYALNQYLGTES